MSRKLAAILIATLVGTALIGFSDATRAADEGAADNSSGSHKDCKVVERPASANNRSGNLSTSVTAGNGQVSAQSSGGQGVTVHSGNGGVSSSVSTTGSGTGSTTVTTSDGNCVIYVNPGKKKKDDRHE